MARLLLIAGLSASPGVRIGRLSPEPRRRGPSPAQPRASLDSVGTTWRLMCAGCPAVTITVWRDETFWARRGPRGAGAEIRHGTWVRSDSNGQSSRLSLFAELSETPTFVLEKRQGTMRLLRASEAWGASVKLPAPLTRAAAVDPIDDVTTFTAIWAGSVHDMSDWMDCRNAERVHVEGDAVHVPVPDDSAFALHGHFRHEMREPPPPPPEWNISRGTRPRAPTLQHTFVATGVAGGVDQKQCPILARLRARGSGAR